MAALKGNLERQRQKILATLWFVHARRMHANEKRPPVPIETKTHQAKNPCCRSKLSRLRRRRSPAQRREGLVSGAAVGDYPVQHMQDFSKCSIQPSPAGVDRTKCDGFASKGTTPERGQSFPEGIETIARTPSSSFENRSSLSSENQNFCKSLFIC